MAKAKFEKAMADWPQTTMLKKEPGFHITGRYAHPSLVHSMPNTYAMMGFVFGGLALVGTANPVPPLVVLAIMWGFYPSWKLMATGWWGKKVDVKILPDKIQVRHGFGYKNYDRNEKIEFKVERHQKAFAEYQKAAEGNRKIPEIYRQAVEVVMQYGEKRVAIAELPETDIEKAKALVIRMGTIADSLDEAVRRMNAGQMVAPGEKSDFGPEPQMR